MIKFNYDLDIDLLSNKPTEEISDEALKIVKDGLKKIQEDIDNLSKRNDI